MSAESGIKSGILSGIAVSPIEQGRGGGLQAAVLRAKGSTKEENFGLEIEATPSQS